MTDSVSTATAVPTLASLKDSRLSPIRRRRRRWPWALLALPGRRRGGAVAATPAGRAGQYGDDGLPVGPLCAAHRLGLRGGAAACRRWPARPPAAWSSCGARRQRAEGRRPDRPAGRQRRAGCHRRRPTRRWPRPAPPRRRPRRSCARPRSSWQRRRRAAARTGPGAAGLRVTAGGGRRAPAPDAARAALALAQAGIASAQAGEAQARAQLQAQQVNRANTEVRAPFDGVVLVKNANVGDMITPFSSAAGTSGAVVTMADMGTLEVEADVSRGQCRPGAHRPAGGDHARRLPEHAFSRQRGAHRAHGRPRQGHGDDQGALRAAGPSHPARDERQGRLPVAGAAPMTPGR
jgi:hypothetical protein